MRISRTGSTPTPSKRGRGTSFGARPNAPAPAQQIGELVLIGEERVVAVERFELPQRRVGARRLQRAVQPTCSAQGNSMSPGTPTTMGRR
jgi:hypothetical protein